MSALCSTLHHFGPSLGLQQMRSSHNTTHGANPLRRHSEEPTSYGTATPYDKSSREVKRHATESPRNHIKIFAKQDHSGQKYAKICTCNLNWPQQCPVSFGRVLPHLLRNNNLFFHRGLLRRKEFSFNTKNLSSWPWSWRASSACVSPAPWQRSKMQSSRKCASSVPCSSPKCLEQVCLAHSFSASPQLWVCNKATDARF